MTRLTRILQCLCLLAGACALGALAFAFARIGVLATDASQTAVDASRAILEARQSLVALRIQTDTALAIFHETALQIDAQASGIRADARGIASKLDRPLRSLDAAIKTAGSSIDHVAGIREDARPVFDESRRAIANLTLTTHDLRPQLLGLVAGWKVVGGETAQTMRDIQRATPAALASFQATAHTVETGFPKIVNNTGGIAENINRLTRPRWYDNFLKVGVSGAAAYGALK